MRATPFEFHAPETVAAALDLLDRYEDEAKILAGGMSMLPAMNLGLLRPSAVISLNRISGLDRITEDDRSLRIGARVTHADVAGSPLVQQHFPLLARAASMIGDVQIRNRGTIGGSLVHGDPAGDYVAPIVALDAQLVLEGSAGARTVSGREFFVDVMRTAIAPNEILVELRIPRLGEGARTAYERFGRLEGSFAIVAAAAVVTDENASVALAGVGPRPLMIAQPAAGLMAGDADAYAALSDAVFRASADAYGDLVGNSDYRRAMARVFAERAVHAALGDGN